jgi:hypothetical protein
MKRVAIFLDGTWNTLNNNTNVWRLKSLCAPDEPGQLVYYSQGVGTRFGEKVRGGVEGYGLDNEIIDAYTWLAQVFETGDGADRPLRRRERGPLDHVNARPDLYEILEERYGRAQPFSPDKACSDARSDLEVEPVTHSIRLSGLGGSVFAVWVASDRRYHLDLGCYSDRSRGVHRQLSMECIRCL